jgi:hypothetical protein
MRQLLGCMLAAVLILGLASLAEAQVAVTVGQPVTYGANYGVYGYTTPFGFATSAVVPTPVVSTSVVGPSYSVLAGPTYYSSAYRGFAPVARPYYAAPVVGYSSYVAPYGYVAPVARIRPRLLPRRAVVYYP